jgi:pheromone shutdown protein TraB
VRSRFQLARGGRGIAGGELQVVKAAQDEASPAELRRENPEAQDLLFAKRDGVLRRNLLEASDVGGVNPSDGRAEA